MLVSSLILGFSIAAPVGPIGVLTIRRTLAHGRLAGLATGMGAASADAVYGALAAFGLTLITDFLVRIQTPISILGALFLLWLGIKTLRTPPADHAAQATGSTLPGMYASSFLLTITNPMTILSFLALFVGAGLMAEGGDTSIVHATVIVAGVFSGSAVWWLLLSGGVGLLRERFTPQIMVWVNRISGAIIILFALRTLLTVV
ncbi:MAG: LysE family transporter [Chloroflexota bacterium]|nr:LysE family transporter [Chloroflexota bacterium]